MPRCTSPLVIGDIVPGEICHIRARKKGGARHDRNLSAAENDEFRNLVLLCRTCHTLIDNDRATYSVELLEEIKELHERAAPLEITDEISRQALMILAKHETRRGNTIVASAVHGSTRASTSGRGVAVAIGGHNQGPIIIHPPRKAPGPKYPTNSIGADANMTNYIDYLCDLYVKYMVPIETDEGKLWGKIGKHIKTKFRLKKRSRNQLSAERFPDLVNFLINEKLAKTPLGARHLRNGTKLCRTFDEFRHGVM